MQAVENAHDQLLVRYLLGMLSDEETERFDEASIEDDALAVRLRIVEQDLIDGFVRRTLSADLTARFESRYLSSPRRRRSVRSAEVFLRAVDRSASEDDPTLQRVRRGTVERAAPLAVAALLVVAAAVLVGDRSPRGDKRRHASAALIVDKSLEPDGSAVAAATRPSRNASIEVRRPMTRDQVTDGHLPIAMVLAPPTRAIVELPSMALPPPDRPIRVELQMASDDFAEYQATLRDPASNGVLWRSAGLHSTRSTDYVASVTLVLAAKLLNSQHYWIELNGLHGRGGADLVGLYVFQVTTR